MMQRRKSNPWARAKLLYVLPLAAVAVAAFARPEVSGVSNELSAAKVTDLAEIVKAGSVKSAVEPQDTARKVHQSYKVHNGTSASAEARAGLEALMKYFDKHVSQSVVTEDGVHSKMIMQIVFNQGGELAEAKVLEGVDPATDAEAVRVMRNIPRSVSEKLKGDTIALGFTVPVKFSVAPLKEGLRQSGSVVTIGEKSFPAKRTPEVPRPEDCNIPEFPGGREAQMKFLAENMRYPQEAREQGIEGKVIVKFAVSDETGEIQNPRVIRSVHPALDAEALRLVKSMPRWTVPGDPDKKKLKSVEVEMPIEFKLDGGKASDGVYDMVEQLPEFPGGPQAMMQFIKDNLKYPQIAKENGIQGRVILQFVVDEAGQVTDPKVIRSIDPSLDTEAIRLVSSMPRWTPGQQDGKAVAVRYTMPVIFSLNEDGTLPQKNSVWMIDGKVVPYEEVKALQPSDIVEMRVWKGEQAKQRFGEQANGDGVIEITTKAAVQTKGEVLSVSAGKMPETSDDLYRHIGILGVGNRKTGAPVSPDSVLILIDGVPASQETFRALSPNQIASVSVLKDEFVKSIPMAEGKKAMISVKTKAGQVAAGEMQVEGVVTDVKGEPIIGAIVQVAGGTKGVVTDTEGRFSISVPKDTKLDVSFVGFQTVRTDAQPQMKITLKAE